MSYLGFLDTLRHTAAVVIPLAVLVAYRFRPALPGRPAYYIDWNVPCDEAQRGSNSTEPSAVFFEYLKRYQKRCDSLHKNVYYWVLLTGLTFLILSRRLGKDLELFSIPIPSGASHVAVISALLFLWMQFGATLRFAIYERMTLWKLVDQVEGSLQGAERRVRLGSIRPMLQGTAFLDGWFNTFLPEYAISSTASGANEKVNRGLNGFVWVTAALMIGLTHASAFVLLGDAGMLWASNPVARCLVPLLQVAVTVLIILCYLYFQFDGHGGRLFLACAFAAGFWIEVLPLVKVIWSPLATSETGGFLGLG